jgi:glycosyltransferase involved in cell wall biosynthesis
MNVVSVSHHADFVGGGELSLLQLLPGLKQRGVSVTLGVPAAGWCMQEAEAAGIPVVTLPMPPIAEPGSIAALQAWLAYFSAHPCDVLHANTSRAAFYAGVTGRRLGIPVLFHCRIAERDWKLDWLLARLVSRIVANSQATARRFLPRYAARVETIHNGIELPKQPPARQPHPELPDGRLLLCAARISRWKRHDRVLDAFALLAERMPELHLVLLGGADPHDPAWMKELEQRAAAMPCAARIHWLGQRDDMDAWYAAADALVLASAEEPFGRVVVEAMAHGVPVVAANAGGPAEIIEQGVSGMLVDEDTPAGWAAALESLLQPGARRERMIEQARQRAGEFSLDRHVERMQALLSRMAGGEA